MPRDDDAFSLMLFINLFKYLLRSFTLPLYITTAYGRLIMRRHSIFLSLPLPIFGRRERDIFDCR